jgi:hypothetical protein
MTEQRCLNCGRKVTRFKNGVPMRTCSSKCTANWRRTCKQIKDLEEKQE